MTKTLYIRNVPDDVADRLTAMAEREGLSVSAIATRELTRVTQRADNAALLDALPSLGFTAEEVVRAVHEGRAGL